MYGVYVVYCGVYGCVCGVMYVMYMFACVNDWDVFMCVLYTCICAHFCIAYGCAFGA